MLSPVSYAYESARETAVSIVAHELGIIEKAQLDALRLAYQVSWKNFAPLYVYSAYSMLPDLRTDAENGRQIVFFERDAKGLELAVEEADPYLFRDHCGRITVSRRTAEAALCDWEATHAALPSTWLRPLDPSLDTSEQLRISGALADLRRHLTDHCRLQLGSGHAITGVDLGFRGSIQEALTIMFPDADFQGRYTFHVKAPGDQNPGAKQGYEFHLTHDLSNAGRAVSFLPADPNRTFQSNFALPVLEYTMCGPLSSAVAFDHNGAPVQLLERDNPQTLARISPVSTALRERLNPVRVDPIHRDPLVREAVLRVNLLAVSDLARLTAARRKAGDEWQRPLQAGRARLIRNTRAWIEYDAPEPDFQVIVDSYVFRSQEYDAKRTLDPAILTAGLSDEEAFKVWLEFDRQPNVRAKQDFATAFSQSVIAHRTTNRSRNQPRSFGAPHPTADPPTSAPNPSR